MYKDKYIKYKTKYLELQDISRTVHVSIADDEDYFNKYNKYKTKYLTLRGGSRSFFKKSNAKAASEIRSNNIQDSINTFKKLKTLSNRDLKKYKEKFGTIKEIIDIQNILVHLIQNMQTDHSFSDMLKFLLDMGKLQEKKIDTSKIINQAVFELSVKHNIYGRYQTIIDKKQQAKTLTLDTKYKENVEEFIKLIDGYISSETSDTEYDTAKKNFDNAKKEYNDKKVEEKLNNARNEYNIEKDKWTKLIDQIWKINQSSTPYFHSNINYARGVLEIRKILKSESSRYILNDIYDYDVIMHFIKKLNFPTLETNNTDDTNVKTGEGKDAARTDGPSGSTTASNDTDVKGLKTLAGIHIVNELLVIDTATPLNSYKEVMMMKQHPRTNNYIFNFPNDFIDQIKYKIEQFFEKNMTKWKNYDIVDNNGNKTLFKPPPIGLCIVPACWPKNSPIITY